MSQSGLIERVVVDGFLVRGFEHAPTLMRRLRPLFARIAWLGAPSWRRSLRSNARHLLGPSSSASAQRRLGLAVLSNMQAFIADVVALPAADPDECASRVGRVEGMEHFFAARAARRGLIIATAHMGSFETALAFLRRHEPAVHVVFSRDALPRFENHRMRARSKLGVHEAPVQNGLTTWITLRDALARNEVVVIACDRTLPGQKSSSIELLGARAKLPAGPVRLAVLAGAPIVPVWCYRDSGGLLTLRADAPLWPAHGLDDSNLVVSLQRSLADALGAVLREHPEQWLAVPAIWEE